MMSAARVVRALALLLCLGGGVVPVALADLRATVNALPGADDAERRALLEAMVSSGDPAMAAVFDALSRGALYLDRRSGEVVLGERRGVGGPRGVGEGAERLVELGRPRLAGAADEVGHGAGDAVLDPGQRVGQRDARRVGGGAARAGGDEGEAAEEHGDGRDRPEGRQERGADGELTHGS